MKKILFLSPLPPPTYGSALASEECLKILKKSKNFEVRNIKLNYSKEMNDVGRINFDKIKGVKNVKNQIKKSIREFKPNIIYFMPATDNFGAIRDYLFFREIRKNTKEKILIHIRTRLPEKNWKNPLFKRIYTGMLSDKNINVIVLGKELVPDLKNLVSKNKIFILSNAIKNEIDKKQLSKIVKQRIRIKPINILFLSNMDRTKGWPKLLYACKILNEKNLDFKCYFAGAWTSKKDEKEFFKYIKKHKLKEKISYFGRVEKSKKEEILKKSHILVFPTEYSLETFGRVIVEAMMFGMPIIANSIATIPSIIRDKKTGFLLWKNTPKEIAEKIEFFINNPKEIEKMGSEGRKRFLEHYELQDYEKKFVKIFNRV